jgi:hypothetical protein
MAVANTLACGNNCGHKKFYSVDHTGLEIEQACSCILLVGPIFSLRLILRLCLITVLENLWQLIGKVINVLKVYLACE